jgi:RimJ/RimL family protein N-acetyltransferase
MRTDTVGPEAPVDPAGRSGAGQTYLVGETIYLRGLEADDAKSAMSWRPSPFPVSAKTLEEQLKKDAADEQGRQEYRLIACRRGDDRPVGSAHFGFAYPPRADVRLTSDRALGMDGARVQAEMLRLLVPWLSAEQHVPALYLRTDADLEPVATAAEAVGMRLAVRLRDGVWRDGRHRDRVIYEYLDPAWVARLGDPGPGIADAGEPVAAPRAPAPRRDAGAALPLPANALLGSERLALRPMEASDAVPIARLLRTEPDASFGLNRFPYSAVLLDDWIDKLGAKAMPTEVEFAVVLRESGELIGENGLYEIDWLGRSAESGSWIYRPEHRGAGYGTEAKHLLLEYAFEWLGMHMIWAWVKEANTRSQAALRKQGYRDAGRVSWFEMDAGGFSGGRMFDLLASEWRAARVGSM